MRINLFNRSPDLANDPVCDMQVDMKKANGGTFEFEGHDLLFLWARLQPCLRERASSLPLWGKENRDVGDHIVDLMSPMDDN